MKYDAEAYIDHLGRLLDGNIRLALERAEEIYLETSMCAERRGDTNLIELRRDAPDVWEQ
mgnify:FL=1